MKAIEELYRIYEDRNALKGAISLLNWDQQVLMPAGGAAARSAHVTLLSRLSHEAFINDRVAELLNRAENQVEPETEEAKALRVLRREYDIHSSTPVELVERKARLTSEAYLAWRTAKAENRFDLLAPYLEELFDIAKETSRLLNSDGHLYDPLIDLFEEGATFAEAHRLFAELKPFTIALLEELRENGQPIDDAPLNGDWNPSTLRSFAETVIGKIGFDLARGRLDIANNAFCTTISSDDIRMTTRPSGHVKGIVSSSIHEMGHGLYEQFSQGVLPPLRGGASLAVHESQSRTWENVVGRSEPFWSHFLGDLQSHESGLSGIGVTEMYRMMNRVEPSFIRVGADELTYNLHILIRFELEVEILTGQIKVKDLPEAWNSKYREYLRIDPPTDSLGCLQDVHWSRGSVGYFPTYTFGNLIGLQIWDRVKQDIPSTDDLMASGDFRPVLEWLVDNVYRHGKSLPPKQLVAQITGQDISPRPWMSYADRKYRELYGLSR